MGGCRGQGGRKLKRLSGTRKRLDIAEELKRIIPIKGEAWRVYSKRGATGQSSWELVGQDLNHCNTTTTPLRLRAATRLQASKGRSAHLHRGGQSACSDLNKGERTRLHWVRTAASWVVDALGARMMLVAGTTKALVCVATRPSRAKHTRNMLLNCGGCVWCGAYCVN